MAGKPAERVISYIDGFNLYFGLRDSNFRRYLWLDVHALSKRLLLPHQVLGQTKYFTARISGSKPSDHVQYAKEKNAKRKRQATYLDALESIPQLLTFEGRYYDNIIACNKCGKTWNSQEEKMTDVNIATEMLTDAFGDQFDTALLISGDSDLVPPVRKIVEVFPAKRIIVAFPPSRNSTELANSASGQFYIAKGHLKKSQLPDSIDTGSFVLKRPSPWC